MHEYIVLGRPLPLFARPLDWPCLVEIFPCLAQYITKPDGVEESSAAKQAAAEAGAEYPGWKRDTDEEGNVYYVNDETGESM